MNSVKKTRFEGFDLVLIAHLFGLKKIGKQAFLLWLHSLPDGIWLSPLQGALQLLAGAFYVSGAKRLSLRRLGPGAPRITFQVSRQSAIWAETVF